MSIPNILKQVAILDRSASEDVKRNKVEEAMTMEIYNQDEQAVRKAHGGFDGCLLRIQSLSARKGSMNGIPGAGKKLYSRNPDLG